MTNRRAMVGGAIIAAWLVGLAVLIHREYDRPQLERLAEAAARVSPGVVYYGVMQGARQVGFASSTIDTAASSITISDYLVADLPVGSTSRRATARTNVTLSRGLRMTHFDLALETASGPITATGRMDGDTVLILAITSETAKVNTKRIALSGPILLPTLIPLAVVLSDTPKLGHHVIVPVFNPVMMAVTDVRVDVRAESLFVVNDSSVLDSTTQRWHGIQPDTLRAWQVIAENNGGFSGWVDEEGRVVQTTQLGFVLRRMPYEVAFENWRSDAAQQPAAESRRRGDACDRRREACRPSNQLAPSSAVKARAEPLIQSRDPAIMVLASQIRLPDNLKIDVLAVNGRLRTPSDRK